MTAIAAPSAQRDKVVELIRSGRVDEAEALARRLLAAAPGDADALNILGGIARLRGDRGRAAGLYAEALQKRPGFTKALSNLGAVLVEEGRYDEAIRHLNEALVLDPAFIDARVNLGTALLEAGKYADAERELTAAVNAVSDDPLAWNGLGNARFHLGKIDDAIAAFERASALDPKLVMALNNLGTAWREKRDRAKAEDAFRRAIAVDANNAEVWSGFGVLLREQGRFGEACMAQERALAIKPGFQMAQFSRGLLALGEGQFDRGFRDYLARELPDNPGLSRDVLPANLAGKRLLLLSDQGLGDELFFLRFARALKGRGAWLAYRGSPAIASILKRSDVLDAIVGKDEPEPKHDMTRSIGDLPYGIGVASAGDLPPALSLPALEEETTAVKELLAGLGPPPYVGLTWRAGTRQWNALLKAVPPDRLGRTLAGVRATFLALQREPEAGEIETLSASLGAPVHDLSSLNKSLERMLALLHCIDIYVGVSNTNTHLRAGTGKPSHVLVSHPPEWRWMNEGDRSPWFPTFPIYRQKVSDAAGGGWDEALISLRRDIDGLLRTVART